MIASLPMYDWPELQYENDQLWKILRQHLLRVGILAPKSLTRNIDLMVHWRDQNLVLSQTCGYPFVKFLAGQVQLVASPTYNVTGCDEGLYSSAIVVRARSNINDFGDTRGLHLACNDRDSMSGYRCMSLLLEDQESWFAQVSISGDHRQSAAFVAGGKADVAAIDAVCWHLLQTFSPEVADGLKVLAWTPKLPSLPFIASAGLSPGDVRKIKLAISQSIDEFDEKSSNTLNIKSIVESSQASYEKLAAL